MTVLDDAPAQVATTVSPTARSTVQRWRGPLLVVLALAVVSVGAALLRSAPGGALDPRSFTPQGTRALSNLLAQQGVDVHVVTTVPALRTDAGTTVVVPFPDGLTADELATLGRAGGRVVLIGASTEALTAAGLPDLDTSTADVQQRRPACDLPSAQRAGDVDLGGLTYRTPPGATGCYASGGRASLVLLSKPDRVLLGSGQLLTNDRLASRGNAALALALLGTTPDVQWLLPLPGVRDTGERGGLGALLPAWVTWAVVQLGVVVLSLALWRARRLGQVVTEPLPVVVRAAESVEGRSRLYRAARSRARAAEALRAGCRDRLRRRLSLPADAGRAALVEAVHQRVAHPAEAVDALLYGAEPADDRALVRLAEDLDTLDREVAGS